ncbi:MAG: transcriptional regulator [Bauldia sp.]
MTRAVSAARGPLVRRGPAAAMADKARAAWDGTPPDWIEELAALADARGLKGAGKAIRYSPSTVSTVISRTYAGDMARVEQMVRGALMGVEVACPVLGAIGRDQCLFHQKREFAPTNAIRTRLYHACRGGCPNARIRQE